MGECIKCGMPLRDCGCATLPSHVPPKTALEAFTRICKEYGRSKADRYLNAIPAHAVDQIADLTANLRAARQTCGHCAEHDCHEIRECLLFEQRAGDLEAKLAVAEEDARAARRERNEANRVCDEGDTAAQHRAGRYATEKGRMQRRAEEAEAKLAAALGALEHYNCSAPDEDTCRLCNQPPTDCTAQVARAALKNAREGNPTICEHAPAPGWTPPDGEGG